MSINLIRRYSVPPPVIRKDEEPKRSSQGILSSGVKKIVKIGFLLGLIIVIYLVLYGQYIEYNTQKTIINEIIKTVESWNQKLIAKRFTVTYKETKQVKNINLDFSRKLRGRILLQPMESGWLWYVYPDDMKRYYVGKPADLNSVIAKLGERISDDQSGTEEEIITGISGRFVTIASGTAAKICGDSVCYDSGIATSTDRTFYMQPGKQDGIKIFDLTLAIEHLRDISTFVSNDLIRTIDVGDSNKISSSNGFAGNESIADELFFPGTNPQSVSSPASLSPEEINNE